MMSKHPNGSTKICNSVDIISRSTKIQAARHAYDRWVKFSVRLRRTRHASRKTCSQLVASAFDEWIKASLSAKLLENECVVDSKDKCFLLLRIFRDWNTEVSSSRLDSTILDNRSKLDGEILPGGSHNEMFL
eukprot:747394-Hanusia_phi.AAC.9